MNLASISARKASKLAFSLMRPLLSIVAISSSVMSDTASPSPRRRVSWIAARALFEILPGSRASQITTWVSNRTIGIAHQNCLYKIAYKSLPHSSGDSAGETTSPVTLPLPLKKPKISSVSVLTGTSFATGSPCLVITTVSRLDLTSSMMARQFVLNAPAGMVFIRSLVDKALDYGHYTIVILLKPLVILSEVAAPRSEAATESKDPIHVGRTTDLKRHFEKRIHGKNSLRRCCQV